MHPRLNELVTHLEATRAEVKAAVASVPSSQYEQAPADGRWSATDIVDHLASIERAITAVIRAKVDAARATGLAEETDTSSVIGSVNGVRIRNRTRQVVAPEQWHPRKDVKMPEALQALNDSRVELLALIGTFDGMAIGTVIAAHPALGDLNMYQWLAFVGFHEGRHAEQIRENGGLMVDS